MVIYFLGINIETILVLSIIYMLWALAAVLLLMVTQYGIHTALSDSKDAILDELLEKRDLLRNEALVKREQNPYSTVIQSYIDDLEEESTWGFETSKVVKIVAASIVPLLYMIASLVINYFWTLIGGS